MQENNVKETVKKILTEYLKKNDHRRTSERYAILDAVYTIKGHFDIETLHKFIDANYDITVSRATVYNTINLFQEANLVMKHQFGASSQYEQSYRNTSHYHMICTGCAKVTEFQDEDLENAIMDIELGEFRPTHHALYIYGLCPKCMSKNKSKKNKRK